MHSKIKTHTYIHTIHTDALTRAKVHGWADLSVEEDLASDGARVGLGAEPLRHLAPRGDRA
jgi:hypothetical protein